jgi:hypothetical protein
VKLGRTIDAAPGVRGAASIVRRARLCRYMFGQCPDREPLGGLCAVDSGDAADGVVCVDEDESLAAFAIAVAPPATAPASDNVTSAAFSRLRTSITPFSVSCALTESGAQGRERRL